MPRFRIYSRIRHYAMIAAAFLAGSARRGTSTEELERSIAARVGTKHAVAVAKARLGIHLSIRHLVPHGGNIVLSPYTISDVVNMVVSAGAKPVFADVEESTCNVSARTIAAVVTPDTKAVMVTHLHGLACDMEDIVALCQERGLALIEDAAQAFGVKDNGRHVGTFGVCGIYSFGMYKNVNSFFGGMVVTDDDAFTERLRTDVQSYPLERPSYFLKKVLSGIIADLATWPPLFRLVTFPIFRMGFLRGAGWLNRQVAIDVNPTMKTELPETYYRRMMPLQARLVLEQLGRVDVAIASRMRLARLYSEGLCDITQVQCPPLRTDGTHTYNYYPIQVEDRDSFLRFMMEQGCDVAAQHYKNCAELPCFGEFRALLPSVARVATRVVLLPTYPGYDDINVRRNIEVIRRFFGLVSR